MKIAVALLGAIVLLTCVHNVPADKPPPNNGVWQDPVDIFQDPLVVKEPIGPPRPVSKRRLAFAPGRIFLPDIWGPIGPKKPIFGPIIVSRRADEESLSALFDVIDSTITKAQNGVTNQELTDAANQVIDIANGLLDGQVEQEVIDAAQEEALEIFHQENLDPFTVPGDDPFTYKAEVLAVALSSWQQLADEAQQEAGQGEPALDNVAAIRYIAEIIAGTVDNSLGLIGDSIQTCLQGEGNVQKRQKVKTTVEFSFNVKATQKSVEAGFTFKFNFGGK